MSRVLIALVALHTCLAQQPPTSPEPAPPTFGVTVVEPGGFCGRIYEIAPPPPKKNLDDCDVKLPRFRELNPIGRIYTRALAVPPRNLNEGFPGVTGRFEWFAIEYTARFWVAAPGKYAFSLLSDDGSALYIDDRRVIDNDCMHPPQTETGAIHLAGGLHTMRVGYFQGPRFSVALLLLVKPPAARKWRIFDTRSFAPPANPADWKYSADEALNAGADPCAAP